MDSASPTPSAAAVPAFTAARVGKPLTPLRREAQVQAVGAALVALVAIGAFANRSPSAAEIAAAVTLALMVAGLRMLTKVHSAARLRSTFHEPLASFPRERLRRLIVRDLFDDVPFLAIIWIATLTPDTEFLTLLAGGLVGAFLSTALHPRAIRRAEQRVGGELLYQQHPWREELKISNWFISREVVFLVDEADPSRWGPHEA